jgi:nitroreductase
MDFSEVVNNRTSTRNFLPKPVEEEKIQTILDLTSLAPSAGNIQAYKIFVVKDKEKMKLIDANIGGVQRKLSNLAPIIFVFCADPDESAKRYGEKGIKLYSIQDATIACSYAQLIATSLHLGTCWVGSFDAKQVLEVIHTDLLPVSILLVGYSLETLPRRSRKPLAQLSEII